MPRYIVAKSHDQTRLRRVVTCRRNFTSVRRSSGKRLALFPRTPSRRIPRCRCSAGRVVGGGVPSRTHGPGWRENQSGAEMSLKTDVAGTTATGDSAWAESATLIDRNRSARRDDCSAATGAIVGQSAAIHRVLAQVQQVAATDATVLLLGETGTGKEVFATRIHELSTRRAHPMVRVNCAAMPATLVESELFGREKG